MTTFIGRQTIELLKPHALWKAGDVIELDTHLATTLISRGIARRADPRKAPPAPPVPPHAGEEEPT
jgi:hypothetical protein